MIIHLQWRHSPVQAGPWFTGVGGHKLQTLVSGIKQRSFFVVFIVKLCDVETRLRNMEFNSLFCSIPLFCTRSNKLLLYSWWVSWIKRLYRRVLDHILWNGGYLFDFFICFLCKQILLAAMMLSARFSTRVLTYDRASIFPAPDFASTCIRCLVGGWGVKSSTRFWLLS